MIITFLNNINNEFEFLGTYFAMSLGIVSVLVMLSWILSWRVRNANRVYSYECGFSPFLSTRLGLSMHTYMVSILFILFDIELALLLPVIFLDTSTPAKLLVIVTLMLSLIVGLFIEIYSGLLDFFRW